jgi:ubiquinol-cytochrome c reductase cytochrome c1 subunit
MKKLLLSLLASLALCSPAFAASEGIAWDKFPEKRVTDLAALQNGARLFVNYCLNCHSAAYMRYNRLRDIGPDRAADQGQPRLRQRQGRAT